MSTQTATIPEWTIQDRLRKAREEAGMTQRELADAIEVAKTTVSNYEAGATTHHRGIVLTAWARATGVPSEWLRWGANPAPKTPGDQGITRSGCFADRHLRAA
jgi:transcriptional regulator with XRE-family HTH domain